MTVFEDLLAELAALDLPTSPGGHPYPLPSSPGRSLWLALAGAAKSLDDFEATVELLEDAIANAGGTAVSLFTASGTWTKPIGAKRVHVIAIGGGGGGGFWNGSGQTFGYVRGGAGGGRDERWLDATALPATVPVVVGAGGSSPAQATASSQNYTGGGAGGASTFGDYARASGGAGGQCVIGSSALPPMPGGPGLSSTYPLYRLDQADGANTWSQPGANGWAQNSRCFNYLEGIGGVPVDTLTPVDAVNDSPFGGGAGGAIYVTNQEDCSLMGRAGRSRATRYGTSPGAIPASDVRGLSGSTTPANGSTVAGAAGTDRTGTGYAGDGGGAVGLYANGPGNVAVIAGRGGLPGGGGGPLYRRTATSGTVQGGPGGRGEVLVVTYR